MRLAAPKPNRRTRPVTVTREDRAEPDAPKETRRRRPRAPSRLGPILRVGGVFFGAYLLFLGAFMLWQELYVFVGDKHYFDLSEIEITGLRHAGKSEVLALSGLAVGSSIFGVDIKAAREGVERHPWVRRANVTRHLPDSVRIEIVENEARALLALDERFYYVNDEGRPFKRVSWEEAQVSALVRIEGLSDQDLTPIEKGQRRLAHALEIIAAYRAHSLGTLAPLAALRHRFDGIELAVGAAPTTLVLGKLEDPRVFDRAARLWRYLAEHGQVAEVIHLDNRPRPERVSVRLVAPKIEEVADGTPKAAATKTEGL